MTDAGYLTNLVPVSQGTLSTVIEPDPPPSSPPSHHRSKQTFQFSQCIETNNIKFNIIPLLFILEGIILVYSLRSEGPNVGVSSFVLNEEQEDLLPGTPLLVVKFTS